MNNQKKPNYKRNNSNLNQNDQKQGGAFQYAELLISTEKERTSPIECLDIAFQLTNNLILPAHGSRSFPSFS